MKRTKFAEYMDRNESMISLPVTWITAGLVLIHFSDNTIIHNLLGIYLVVSVFIVAGLVLTSIAMFCGLLWRAFRWAAGQH